MKNLTFLLGVFLLTVVLISCKKEDVTPKDSWEYYVQSNTALDVARFQPVNGYGLAIEGRSVFGGSISCEKGMQVFFQAQTTPQNTATIHITVRKNKTLVYSDLVQGFEQDGLIYYQLVLE